MTLKAVLANYGIEDRDFTESEVVTEVCEKLVLATDLIGGRWSGEKAQQFAADCARKALEWGYFPAYYRIHLQRISLRQGPKKSDAKLASRIALNCAAVEGQWELERNRQIALLKENHERE